MKRLKSCAFAATLALCGLSAGPVQAQTVSAARPDSIAAVLKARGLPSELKRPDDGMPYITSAYDNLPFVIALMNCSDAKTDCKTLQFYFGFNDRKGFSLEKLNTWNQTKRFVRAYRDNDDDPVLVMDIDTDKGGVPQAVFNENLDVWLSQMQDYRTLVNE